MASHNKGERGWEKEKREEEKNNLRTDHLKTTKVVHMVEN